MHTVNCNWCTRVTDGEFEKTSHLMVIQTRLAHWRARAWSLVHFSLRILLSGSFHLQSPLSPPLPLTHRSTRPNTIAASYTRVERESEREKTLVPSTSLTTRTVVASVLPLFLMYASHTCIHPWTVQGAGHEWMKVHVSFFLLLSISLSLLRVIHTSAQNTEQLYASFSQE